MLNKRLLILLSLFFGLLYWGVSNYVCGQERKLELNGVTTFSLGKPIVIMAASSDSVGDEFDNRYLGYFTILQLRPDLFYMYYECSGSNRHTSNHIAFAYSNDGLNWVKRYPRGVSHDIIGEDSLPIRNSNIIFFQDIREFDVVRVPDFEYPFRMIANEWINKDRYKNDTQMCMWKSKDGINFVEKTIILPSKHDTQPSVIVKGNILKIYLRLRGPHNIRNRHVGYMYVDLSGVIIAPPTLLSEDLYYSSSASQLDENREILFPTFFDERKPSENHYEACIVEGNKIFKLNVDMSVLCHDSDKWGIICPHIITINHEEAKRTEFRLSKIVFDKSGQPCPADPK